MENFLKIFLSSFIKQIKEFNRYPNFYLKSLFYTPIAILLPFWFTIRFFLNNNDVNSINTSFTLLLGVILWNFIYFSVIEAYNIISRELNTDTIYLVFLAPISKIAWLLGASFAPSIMFIFSLGIVTVIFYLITQPVIMINGLLFITALVLTVILSWSMSLGVFILTIWLKRIFNILNIGLEIIAIFVGVLYPVSHIPSFIRVISYCIPLTYGISLFRQSFVGVNLSSVGYEVLAMALFTLFYMLISIIFFNRFERRLKQNGSFLQY
ncbi:MAG: ABC transporter permease [Halanaerobiales bacterium]|nr:ABC transporter permease [Halanaerobiales bacterium]